MKDDRLTTLAQLRKRAAENPVRPPIGVEAENRPVVPPEGGGTTQDTAKPKRAAPAARKRAEPQPPAEPKRVYPWEEADPRVPKVFNLRFDEVTWTQLKYLGDTTYGETMHSIAMTAVKDVIAAKLRALGVKI